MQKILKFLYKCKNKKAKKLWKQKLFKILLKWKQFSNKILNDPTVHDKCWIFAFYNYYRIK